MTLSIQFAPIAEKIKPKTLILTPNARTQQAVEAERAASLKPDEVVRGLNIFAFKQWQDFLWQQLSFLQPLPRGIKELTIKTWFKNQVEKEPQWLLTNPQGVADQVTEAYKNLTHWLLPVEQIDTNESLEVSYFVQWVQAFEDFCQQKDLIPEFKKLAFILDHLSLIGAQLPKKILMIGFTHLTPLEEMLLEKLKAVGIEIQFYRASERNESQQAIVFDDLKGELAFAASYAQEHLNQTGISGSSTPIAILVDQLDQNLELVHEVFSQQFHPMENKPWIPLSKPKYNVSAGLALSEQPRIKAALRLLNINPNKMDFETLQFLKNTPFIQWGRDADLIRAFLHQQVLKGVGEIDIGYLRYQIEKSEKVSQLSVLLQLLESLSNLRKKLNMAEHLQAWLNLLNDIGVIDSSRQTSNDDPFEIQAVELFLKACQQSIELDSIDSATSFTSAFDYLYQICQQQSFQIASDRSNIHILGMLEASGLEFDQVILVGFSQESWPRNNKINPFIPLHLQRQLQMPGSSAAREYHYAKKLSDSLIASSRQMIATASRDPVSQESNLSHLFASFKQVQLEQFLEANPSFNNVFQAAQDSSKKTLCSAFQWQVLQPLNMQSIEIKGGAYLLSDYAKCPFQAMLKYTFGVKNYEQPSLGIDPREKGSWLHLAMEKIWSNLKNQQSLIKLDDDELRDLIRCSVENLLDDKLANLKKRIDKALLQMESEKMCQKIFEWLSIEKNREAFQVDALEKPLQLKFQDFSLNLKVDRIDVNPQKQFTIIDYKTGKCDLTSWFSARPTEAQMPIYYLLFEQQSVEALHYAQIKTGDIGRLGLVIKDETLEAVNDNGKRKTSNYFDRFKVFDQSDLTKQWRQTIDRLADGIASGYFPVSPKDVSKYCQYCDFSSICRLQEEQPDE